MDGRQTHTLVNLQYSVGVSLSHTALWVKLKKQQHKNSQVRQPLGQYGQKSKICGRLWIENGRSTGPSSKQNVRLLMQM